MKITTFIAFTLLAVSSIAYSEETSSLQPDTAARIFLLDDQSGTELARDHGIKPIEIDDLLVVVNGVIANRREVRLMHQVVDEDASDNVTTSLHFAVFEGGQFPTPPARGLPIGQLKAAMEKYQAQREKLLLAVRKYQQGVQEDVKNFVDGIAAAQTEVSVRHDALLLERNGRDFNRSDIAGAIQNAAGALGDSGLRVLVLNTDAVDRPGDGNIRKTSFTEEELDPEILLIWVNTSGLGKENSVLFSGTANPSLQANTMTDAMNLVNALLEGKPLEDIEADREGSEPRDNSHHD